MSAHLVDSVLSARRRALPVYLSPDPAASSSSGAMPAAVVLEPRATTMFLSVFFDAGVQSSAPWLSIAAMFGAPPPASAASTLSERTANVNADAHPTLSAALMRIVCPSRVLRAKVLLAITECALKRIDKVRVLPSLRSTVGRIVFSTFHARLNFCPDR
jgi:hypothetical protein